MDIQAMLWIGDAWNIDDIHHRLLWDGNDSMNRRAAACQSRHVAAKSNLRHTRDILRTGTCVAWDVASMSGASFFVGLIAKLQEALTDTWLFQSNIFHQIYYKFCCISAKLTTGESGLMAILSIVLGPCVAENVASTVQQKEFGSFVAHA